LFELGLEKYCTYIILADTDYETQKRRVMSRDHVTEAEVEKIIRCQINNAQKKVLSDLIVDTNRPKGILKAALLQVIGELINGQGNSI
jgi:dephospho-CoA kinase